MNDVDAVNLAMLIMRVGFGLMMMAHGYNHFFRGGRIAGTGRWFDSLGMKPGRIHAIIASATELGAGALFALGLLTPFAAAGFIGLMTVAIWTVHRKNRLRLPNAGLSAVRRRERPAEVLARPRTRHRRRPVGHLRVLAGAAARPGREPRPAGRLLPPEQEVS